MTYAETLKKILESYKNFTGTRKFYFLVFVGLITTIIARFEPLFAAKIIAYIENFIKNGVFNTNEVIIFFIVWIGYIIINSLIRYYFRYNLVAETDLYFYTNQANIYKDKILRMTELEFLNKKSGKIYKIFDRGMDRMFNVIFNLFLDIFPSFISIFFISIFLIIVNPILALATLIVIPIAALIGYHFGGKTSFLQNELNVKRDSFFGKLGDAVTNLTLVKTLNFEKNISQDLENIQETCLNLQLPISKRWAISDIYMQFLINISRFLVIGTGLYLISKGSLNFATLFLFFSYIGYIYYPLGAIFGQLQNIQKNLEGAKKIYEEFDNIEQDSELEKSKDIEKIMGKIEFKDVSFIYKGSEEEVIKKINFNINPGEKIALVGSTGSGKTTIAKLLLRLFEINSGKIEIDGIDVQNITKKSLRKHIGIVMQDNTLFNTSILENMQFAKVDATKEEIESALHKAKANFVFSSEKGLDTIIGERGLKLSGGEKQRLNIARIFLRNPEILILDEATSALDNKTEMEIQKSLEELLEGKTSIIIAHRLSTIKKVDRIFVLDKGKIVETGTYSELIDKKGKFFELANPDKMILN
ncbi:MAG: ABC transporter ATP-binding protein [Candidatus Gracilibacteria bacterium]|nr:ABC transporter ATP-binding protein [Candidatus Gracilibacteria bacterium]